MGLDRSVDRVEIGVEIGVQIGSIYDYIGAR